MPVTLGRRSVLKLVSGSVAWAVLPGATAATINPGNAARVVAQSGSLAIAFDRDLRTCLAWQGQAINDYAASETLLIKDAAAIERFAFTGEKVLGARDPRHGAGRRHVVSGRSEQGVEKTVTVTFYERYPGMALLQTTYTNRGAEALEVAGWRNAAHALADAPEGFWSFSGATHTDRRDWVQPMTAGFAQRNTLGMDSSDYGGGTPVANIWRRDVGLAVGHVAPIPRLIDLPVSKTATGADIAVESNQPVTLAPGASLTSELTFLCVHKGDHFAPLVHYKRFMEDQGIQGPEVPASTFDPIWCAWGYERDFTIEQVLGTLPKVREMGFEWAVLDDGWQTNEGDWALDPRKFPNGDEDMRAFVREIRAQGLRPRLWLAPLACDPGSDILHDRPDMLLLDEEGSVQKVTWWNAFTQCPAYQPTIDFYVALTKKIIGDWGFEGLKLDGQHLNAVAPCYNPLHKHAKPTDSFEKMGDFWNAIYKAAHDANPNAVVELCPCGTAFAFHNLPATDQYPSSDPLSSWQIRHKGKSIKALIGKRSSYAGDHVELSDGRDDWATSVGIGAVISTKFTWPKDPEHTQQPLPPGGYVLTPDKEVIWRKWVDLYKKHMLPLGDYRGDLYDIGFDKPETHAISKDGAMYYTFYADDWNGALTLRGLGKGSYQVRDLFNEVDLGTVDARANTVNASFKRFLLLQATPVGAKA
ncbi:glycoside hydrolase family 36 protein [Pseudoxanthomonas indica]|uniref:Alpha-galactosidase n=1 Tax=Pseudoxanthomonas indica TaxID=428993 RepID=A0A1T5K875_9GAMM|nr:glycoside hydrolase family 36 protein [Pseudoxanthomonas indica]GGD47456.1 alpha-galactosidase [Pseudoxanthomonas indica]SKC59886.1 alpha-galactosidase [Pseudoxanthomonas indica]